MPKITINNLLGLAPAGLIRTNLKIGQPWEVANSFAVNLVKNPGVISLGLTTSTNLDTNSKITALIKNIIHYDDGTTPYAYLIEDGNKIHQIDSNETQAVDQDADYPIILVPEGSHTSHTAYVCEDVVVYKAYGNSTLKNSIFVSYRDNTDGDVMRFDPDGSNADKNFLSGSASATVLSTAPHPMIKADNAFLYIADREAIHKYDGSLSPNGTTTLSVIDIPVGWTIGDMIDYRGFALIVGIDDPNYPGVSGNKPARKAAVYVWNYLRNQSSDFSGFEKGSPISLGKVNKLGPIFVHSDGQLYLFVISANLRTQLRIFNGNSFETIFDEPGDILPKYKGSISDYFGHIKWSDSTGGIHTFKYPEKYYNNIGQVSNDAGAISIGSGGNYWISSNGNKLNLLAGVYEASSFTLLTKEFPKLSRIDAITLFYPTHTDTTIGTLTMNPYKNFSLNPISGTYQLTHALDKSRGWKRFQCGGKNWENINVLRLHFAWSLSSATASFEPYRIEIEFSETEKKK